MYLKPLVTKRAAERYGYAFDYSSKPQWPTYASLLEFARIVSRDVRDLRPRDQIDIQSFSRARDCRRFWTKYANEHHAAFSRVAPAVVEVGTLVDANGCARGLGLPCLALGTGKLARCARPTTRARRSRAQLDGFAVPTRAGWARA